MPSAFPIFPTSGYDWTEVRRRAAAAAALSMRGASYSDDDRADCAAHILDTVLAELGSSRVTRDDRPTGRNTTRAAVESPRDFAVRLTRYIGTALDGGYPTRDTEREPSARKVALPRLAGIAANFRRSLDSQRSRDALALSMRGEDDAWTVPSAEDVALATVPLATEDGASRDALTLMRRLPSAGRTANVASALYFAARERSGANVAAELEVSPQALRKAVSRGTATLRALGTADDYRAALGCAVHSKLTTESLAPRIGYAPRLSTKRTRRLAHDERVHGTETVRRSDGRGSRAVKLYAPLPVTLTERKMPGAPRKLWTAASGIRADWTRSMTPGRASIRSRSRLSVLARITRERTYTAPMAERSTRRLAAGIKRPPTVPASRRVTALAAVES